MKYLGKEVTIVSYCLDTKEVILDDGGVRDIIIPESVIKELELEKGDDLERDIIVAKFAAELKVLTNSITHSDKDSIISEVFERYL